MRFPSAPAAFVLVALALAGCGDRSGPPASALVSSSTRPAGATEPAAPKAWTRDEFKALVMGKTPDEVIAAVGKPDETREDDRGQTWYYKNRTLDPITSKADYQVRVRFRDGLVANVTY